MDHQAPPAEISMIITDGGRMVLRPGDDGLPLSTIRAYASPSITGLVVFTEVEGRPRVTYALDVDDFNVKPP